MGNGGSSPKRIEPVILTTNAIENDQDINKKPPEHFRGFLLNSHSNNSNPIYSYFLLFILLIIFIIILLYYYKSTT